MSINVYLLTYTTPTLAQSLLYLLLTHARSCLRSIFQHPRPPTRTQVSGNRRHDCWWHRLCPHLFVSISITINLVHQSISFPSPTFSSSYRELDRSGPPCSAADWRHPCIAAPLTDMPSYILPSSWHRFSIHPKTSEREKNINYNIITHVWCCISYLVVLFQMDQIERGKVTSQCPFPVRSW